MMSSLDLNSWGRILVLGAGGQLSTAFSELTPSAKSIQIGFPEIDFAKPGDLAELIHAHKPDIIINTVAYTQVDLAEKEEDLCRRVNAGAVEEIAQTCKELDIFFIHFSTDYVFDGQKKQPYLETDDTNPLNIYGRTKLEGEQHLQSIDPRYLIFRTSWVYSETGTNFIKTMLELAKKYPQLSVVDDQSSSPTYAIELALQTLELLNRNSKDDLATGLFHLTPQDYCNRFELTQTLFEYQKNITPGFIIPELQAVTSDHFPTPAQRPLITKLNSQRAKCLLGIELKDWRKSLNDCIVKLNRSHRP